MNAPIADRIAEVLRDLPSTCQHDNRIESLGACTFCVGRWLAPLVEEAAQEAVDAALAPAEATAAEWDAEPNLPPSTYNLVDDFRDALRAGRHNAAQLTPPEPREERGNGR